MGGWNCNLSEEDSSFTSFSITCADLLLPPHLQQTTVLPPPPRVCLLHNVVYNSPLRVCVSNVHLVFPEKEQVETKLMRLLFSI